MHGHMDVLHFFDIQETLLVNFVPLQLVPQRSCVKCDLLNRTGGYLHLVRLLRDPLSSCICVTYLMTVERSVDNELERMRKEAVVVEIEFSGENPIVFSEQ